MHKRLVLALVFMLASLLHVLRVTTTQAKYKHKRMERFQFSCAYGCVVRVNQA